MGTWDGIRFAMCVFEIQLLILPSYILTLGCIQ